MTVTSFALTSSSLRDLCSNYGRVLQRAMWNMTNMIDLYTTIDRGSLVHQPLDVNGILRPSHSL